MRYTLLLLILAFSCTKDKQPNSGVNNKVTLGPTSQVTSIMVNSAISGGNVLTVGVDDVLEKGVCWNTAGKPTISNSKTVNGKGVGAFTSNLTNLAPGTRYSVRSYATTQTETLYGTEVTFTTLLCPTVGTGTILDVTGSSANASGNLTSNGGQTILERGFCYSTSTNPTISNSRVVVVGTTLGIFSANLSGLTANTTYYVRAYVTTNACAATYGNELSFKTPSVPVLTTIAPSNIRLSDALSGGNVTSDGGNPVSARGVCWSVNPGPTINNPRTLNGTGVGSFNSSITGLAQNTTYYVRSYATNAAGTGYGNEISFKTIGLPQLATTVASSVTSLSAVSGGSVVSDGGLPVTARGVCWGISPGPTPSGSSRSIDGSGLGQFSSLITGLVANTRYYYRAYATHSLGTGYGPELSFVTGFTTPTVSTSSISSITQTTAVGGGLISNDGGASVTSRGVCWNLSGNPSIFDSRTFDGSGTGSFASSITGLSPNRTYYVRAYATNSAGTAYGTQTSFTTQSITCPTVSTSGATGTNSNSVSIGGNVSSAGGGTVSVRGVCWNTTGNPTVSNTRTIDGSGTGTFSSQMTSLQPGTTYYVRAYATNEVCTTYGAQVAVTTSPLTLSAPTLNSPISGATVGCCSANFSWGSVANAGGYEIQISRSSTFSGTIYTTTSIDCGGGFNPQTSGVNSRSVSAINYCMRMGTSSLNGTWYWRVRAYNGSILSSWSTVRSYIYRF